MSRGSPIVPVRISPELLSQLKSLLEERNQRSSGAEWSMSDYIRSALAEKVAHTMRSRKGRKKPKGVIVHNVKEGGEQ